jgi:ubiquinol-cytochrome c reductase cytochrome b subunit
MARTATAPGVPTTALARAAAEIDDRLLLDGGPGSREYRSL